MSEVHAVVINEQASKRKPLWPVAAVILLVVFLPALIVWAITTLRP